MNDHQATQPNTSGVITLEGPLTIQQAGDLKDTLLHSLNTMKQIVLNLEKVTELDVACLQILCSAYRTAVTRDKSMVLAGRLPDAINKVVEDGGFSCRSGCAAKPGKTCPWITGRN